MSPRPKPTLGAGGPLSAPHNCPCPARRAWHGEPGPAQRCGSDASGGLAPGPSRRSRPAAPPAPSPARGGPGAVLARGAGREACPREGGGATAATGPSPSSASAAAASGKAPPSPPLSGTCAGRRGERREFGAEGCRGGRGAAAAVPHPLLCRLGSRRRAPAAGGPLLAARGPRPGRPRSLDPSRRAPGPAPAAPGSRSPPLPLGRRSGAEAERSWAGLFKAIR